MKKILFALIPCLVLLAVLELLLRATGFAYAPRQRTLYKPWIAVRLGTHEEVWPTVFDPPDYIWLRQDYIVGQNPDGSNRYIWPTEKTPGVKRIAFLGGSTTEQGGDHSFAHRTVALLNAVLGSNKYDCINYGASSYCSGQSKIALRRYVLPRNPDLVVIYHGWNDCGLPEDGFSNKEKEWLFRKELDREKPGPVTEALQSLRSTQLVGKLIDVCDVTWPRVNVSPKDFRQNLLDMIAMCGEKNIPVVLLVRPKSNRPTAPLCGAYDVKYRLHYGPVFGTNDNAIYRGMHKLYSGITRELGAAMPAVALADVDAHLDQAQRELDPPVEGVTVFTEDDMHTTQYGLQKIAEAVALAIEPGLKDKVQAYTDSAEYWKNLALDFQKIDSPFECAYAARQALKRDPALSPALDPLIQWAESQFAFWRLFLDCFWIGYRRQGHEFEKDFANIQKCLEMRPDDFGVCQQVQRVCIYYNRGEMAAPALMKFKPKTPDDRYRWLKLLFMSLAQAQKWPELEKVSRDLLALNPNDPEPAQFLKAWEEQKKRLKPQNTLPPMLIR